MNVCLKTKPSTIALTMGWLLMCTACSTFSEEYHLRGQGAGTNYFRVHISGYSMLSSSQYAAGLYDADAVDALFGELEGKRIAVDWTNLRGHPTRNAETEEPPASSTDAKPASAPARAAKDQTESGSGQRKKLVVFLSTNSDFFVQQISNFVRNANIQTGLSQLILRDEIDELAEARGRATPTAGECDALASNLRAAGTRLAFVAGADGAASSPSLDDTRTALVATVRRLAYASREAASASAIIDLPSARQWLAAHPQAFQAEVMP